MKGKMYGWMCYDISEKLQFCQQGKEKHLVPPVPRQLDPQGPLVSSLNV